MNSFTYSYRGFDNGANGLLAGMGTGMMVVMLALAIFEIVCMWRIFEKAGEAGWKCLIPIYNAFVYMKICWEAKYFGYLLLGIIAAAVLSGIGIGANSDVLSGIGGFLMIVLYIAIFVVMIIAMIKLAKRFGKSGGFAVGLILLSIVFMAILAFDGSDYDRRRTDPGYQPGKVSEPEDPYHQNNSF